MPRYLGVNYWQKRIEQRREFYARALLTVPQNLSSAGVIIEHDIFNEQWRQFQRLGEFEDPSPSDSCNLNWQLGSDCFEFWKHKLNGPERFCCGIQVRFRGIGEVIPSSNPDSEDSLETDDLSTPKDESETAVEQFAKEDLKHSGLNLKGSLEDIVTSEGLKEIHKNIPQLHRLISRLQPRPVKDPLADDAGTHYTENICFKDHLTLHENEAADDQRETCEFETFQVIPKVFHEDEGVLEEVLIPPTRCKMDDHVEAVLDIRAKVGELLKQQTEDHLNTQDMLNIVQGSNLEQDVDKPDIESSTILSANFLTFNKSVECHDKQLAEAAVLESPILPPSDSLEALYSPGTIQLSRDLQPISVELNRPILFLRQFEKETLLVRVWQQEKFFDEILSLRLQEPEVEPGSPARYVSVLRVKERLGLGEETGLGGLELQLPWDPWVCCRDLLQRAAQPEPFNPERACLTQPAHIEVEQFNKFEKDQLNDGVETSIVDGGLQEKEPKAVSDAKQEIQELTKQNEAIENKYQSTDAGEKKKQERRASLMTDANLTDFSPLDEFMMLRSSLTKAQEFQPVYHQLKKRSVDPLDEPLKTVQDPVAPARREEIIVNLSAEYIEVLESLHVFGKPYLNLLLKAGELPPSASFSNIRLDQAEFLLKQREKQSKHSSEETSDTYKCLVVLYAVVGAGDLLIHCSLESAISHLAAIQEKFHKTLGACLDDIRKQLFQFKAALDQANVLHPKVARLCRTIQGVVSDASTHTTHRVLVVLKRNLSCLSSCMEKTLNMTGNISTKVIRVLNDKTSNLIESHKCIVISEEALNDKLELSAFGLAIQYESGPSPLSRNCQLAHVNFLSLSCSYQNQDDHKRKSTSMMPVNPGVKVTVICAQTVTKHKHLLQLLESRYNIAIIERHQDEESQVPIADIIIDERHCIVLHEVSKIKEDYQVEHLTRKLSSLCLQYTHCWLVFHCTSPAKSYILPSKIMENLSKVEAALANLNKNQDHFHIFYKVLMAYSVDELAGVLRRCCDVGVETSTVWSGEQWSRDWISPEPSQEERFLASIPCITSFSAQFMLSKCCLGSLLSYSLPELVGTLPQLPEKVLLMFYKMVNCDTGLHLRSSESNTLHQEVYLDTSNLDGGAFNQEGVKTQEHYQQTNWDKEQPEESVYRDTHLPGLGQGTQGQERNLGAKIPPTMFCPGSFTPLTALENMNSFSQDSEDSSLAKVYESNKPNQYVIAELEGMARKERQLEEFTDFPNFNIMGTSLQNGIEDENKYFNANYSDCTDISNFNLHMPQSNNVPLSSVYNTVNNNVPSIQSCTRKRQSLCNLLHDKAKTRNQILEKFKENNSNRGFMNSCTQNKHRILPGKLDSELNVPERVNHTSYLSGGMSGDAYRPEQPEGVHTSKPLPRSRQRKAVLSEHFQNMLPRPTPRRPVLSEHFRSRLLQPSEHRVSIGLAQPLRRSLPLQDSYKETQVVPNISRWQGQESPPMDLDISPEIRYHHGLKDSDSVQIHGDNSMYKCGISPEYLYLGGYQYDTPHKRKKLSYQPLPGRSAGQTVLTFK